MISLKELCQKSVRHDLKALNKTVVTEAPNREDTDVVYEKTGVSTLSLFGRFKRSSAGQEFIEGRPLRGLGTGWLKYAPSHLNCEFYSGFFLPHSRGLNWTDQ